jgi:hypothetical protein
VSFKNYYSKCEEEGHVECVGNWLEKREKLRIGSFVAVGICFALIFLSSSFIAP